MEWAILREEFVQDEDVVFALYASSNHFGEARAAISHIRKTFKNRIVFFDLGLSAAEVRKLRNRFSV